METHAAPAAAVDGSSGDVSPSSARPTKATPREDPVEQGDPESTRVPEGGCPLSGSGSGDGSGGATARAVFQGNAIVADLAQFSPSDSEESDAVAAAAKQIESEREEGEGEDDSAEHGSGEGETFIGAAEKNAPLAKSKHVSDGGEEVGAVQVHDQAPDINRRYYLGLDRQSVCVRRQKARAARHRRRTDNANATATGNEDEGQTGQRRATAPSSTAEGGREGGERGVSRPLHERKASAPGRMNSGAGDEEVAENGSGMRKNKSLPCIYDESNLIEATLVNDEEGEVVLAERVGFFERKMKAIALALCVGLGSLAVALSLTMTKLTGQAAQMLETPTPSMSPTFDPRPTLEIVQERGHVRCGLFNSTITAGRGFLYDWCRSVAAVAVGNPESFEGVPVTFASRWKHLVDREVDVVILGDTHTVEREVNESSTGSGFTFSTPIFYDGMMYFGNAIFVDCAEKHKRFAECSDLLICVEGETTYYDYLQHSFPSDYIKVGSSLEQILDMLVAKKCNVLTTESFRIMNKVLWDEFTWGTQKMTKEPLAIVTNNHDHTWSDVVNWVVQAVLVGEEEGLRQNSSLCQNYTDSTLRSVSELRFLNAVFCVGNYEEILLDNMANINNRDENQLNNGTGMLYAIPFGNLDRDEFSGPTGSSTLAEIRNKTSLRCGVVVPPSFVGNVTDRDELVAMVADSDNLVGMGVDFCRALAAAIFIGDPHAVQFLPFLENENSSVIALTNGTIDVLVGERVQQTYDFETSEFGGLHFSTPYYYGSESTGDDGSIYSMATLEGDAMFASFVNSIVLATIFAEENDIRKNKSGNILRYTSPTIPFVSAFGSELKWALKDAIASAGSHAEIYAHNFGDEAYESRNTLNKGGPLMHSLPLYHELLDIEGTQHLHPDNNAA